MARARLGNFFARCLGLRLERAHLRAVGLGTGNPVLQALGLWHDKLQLGHIQRVQRRHGLVNQHLELLLRVADVLAGLNLLRQRHVKTRLRLVHIGADAGTRRKNLACRVQLGFIEGLLRQHQRQLFGGQYRFKISHRHPHHQVLLFLCQRGLGIVHLRLGLADLGSQHGAVQGLAHGQRLVAAEVAGGGGLVAPQKTRRGAGKMVAGVVQVHRNIGPQLRPRLWQALLAGLGGGAGGQNIGILQSGGFIRLQQVQRPGHHGETEQCRAQQRGFQHAFEHSFSNGF